MATDFQRKDIVKTREKMAIYRPGREKAGTEDFLTMPQKSQPAKTLTMVFQPGRKYMSVFTPPILWAFAMTALAN